MNFLRSLVAKYEPLIFTFGKVFVYSFIGTILAYWIGFTPISVSGLVGAIRSQWDAAAGSALVIGLAAVGFKIPAAIKSKSI